MAQPQHAVLAVQAALAMAEALERFASDLAREDPAVRFAIGIGVHTGPAVVGFLGTQRRLDYTAIGDTVNTASRIESMTKELGHSLLISASTWEAAEPKPEAKVIALGDLLVKMPAGADQTISVRLKQC